MASETSNRISFPVFGGFAVWLDFFFFWLQDKLFIQMWFADSVVHPMSLHLLTVVKLKLCKCCATGVTGPWALEIVSEQKLIVVNEGTCQITAWFYFLFCCFLKIILQGQSCHTEHWVATVLKASLEAVGNKVQVKIRSQLQTWLKSASDSWKSGAGAVIYSVQFLSKLNRNPLPEAENTCLLNIWGRICRVKPSG